MSGRKVRSKLERYAAYKAVNGICPSDNEPIKFWDSHLDHVVPLAVGGLDDWPNLLCVHKQTNIGKGASRYLPRKEAKLQKLAVKLEPSIKAMLADKTFSIPDEHATKFDLYKVHFEEILADVGPTASWSVKMMKVLIQCWLDFGVNGVRLAAQKLGRTIQSIRSKLCSLQLYRSDFLGQY